MQDGPRLPDFKELFAGAGKAVRREAIIAAEDIPPKVDRLAVRRILARARHRERIHRLVVDARQDDSARRDAAGAVKYLERTLKHFDPVFRPESFQRAIDDLRLLTRPMIWRTRRAEQSQAVASRDQEIRELLEEALRRLGEDSP